MHFDKSNSGLPDNSVTCVSFDSLGNRWIGTNRGLVKFDGNTWSTKEGKISTKDKSYTKIGMILGIIGTFISPFIIIEMGFLNGINNFSSYEIKANREAMVVNCRKIATVAQLYYNRTLENGTKHTFIGFQIPDTMINNGNGSFVLKNVESSSIIINDIGKVKGANKSIPVEISIMVYPDRLEKVKVIN